MDDVLPLTIAEGINGDVIIDRCEKFMHGLCLENDVRRNTLFGDHWIGIAAALRNRTRELKVSVPTSRASSSRLKMKQNPPSDAEARARQREEDYYTLPNVKRQKLQ